MKSDTQKGSYVFPKRDNIWRLLAPSLLGIAVCVMCMVGLTMAWFSSSKVTQTLPVSTTTFEGRVSVKDQNPGDDVIQPEDGWYKLQAGNQYSVELNGAENEFSTVGTGFAIITLQSSSGSNDFVTYIYRSSDIKPLLTTYIDVTFEIEAQVSCQMKVDFHWGMSTDEYCNTVVNTGDIITFSSQPILSDDSSASEDPSEPAEGGQISSSPSSSQNTTTGSVSSSGAASSESSSGTVSDDGSSVDEPSSDDTASGGTQSDGVESSSNETGSSEIPAEGSASGVSSAVADGPADTESSASGSAESAPAGSAPAETGSSEPGGAASMPDVSE